MKWTILLSDLIQNAYIGIFEEEQNSMQPIKINIKAKYMTGDIPKEIENAVCYYTMMEKISSFISHNKFRLLENMAHQIIILCFQEFKIYEMKLKIEKIKTHSSLGAMGIEITRTRKQLSIFL